MIGIQQFSNNDKFKFFSLEVNFFKTMELLVSIFRDHSCSCREGRCSRTAYQKFHIFHRVSILTTGIPPNSRWSQNREKNKGLADNLSICSAYSTISFSYVQFFKVLLRMYSYFKKCMHGILGMNKLWLYAINNDNREWQRASYLCIRSLLHTIVCPPWYLVFTVWYHVDLIGQA